MRSALVVLMAVAAACSNSLSPSDNLRIETSLSAPTIQPGESVTVSVVVTNDGTRIRQIAASSGFCPAPFVAIAEDGTVIRPSAMCALIAYPPRDLAPGESMVLSSQWSGDSQPGGVIQGPPPTMQPAGTYELRGIIWVHGVGELDGPPVELQILS